MFQDSRGTLRSPEGLSAEFVRSSSFVAATGSGSSALLKNVEYVSQETVERIARNLGLEVSAETLRRVQEQVNQDTQFDPEAPKFDWLHRDLIPQPNQIKRGHDTRVKVVNQSYESVFCSDTAEFAIPFGDELQFAVCSDSQRLTTVNILPRTRPGAPGSPRVSARLAR